MCDRTLSAAELLANAEVHFEGTEPGMVECWKFDGPPNPLQIQNEVTGSPPLKLGFDNEFEKPLRKTTILTHQSLVTIGQ